MEAEKINARPETLFHHLGALYALAAAHSGSAAFHPAWPAEGFCLPDAAGRCARATTIGISVWRRRVAGISRRRIFARRIVYATGRVPAVRRNGRGLLHGPRAARLLARS